MDFLQIVWSLFLIALLFAIPLGLLWMLLNLPTKLKVERFSATANPGRPPKAGLQVTGLVVGILSVLFAWAGVVALIASVYGITFSAFGMKRTHLRGVAIGGLVTSIVGFVSAGLVTLLYTVISTLA